MTEHYGPETHKFLKWYRDWRLRTGADNCAGEVATMKTTPERLAELEERQKLLAAGHVQKACNRCKGTGLVTTPETSMWHAVTDNCPTCSGKGWVWQAPMER